MTTLLGTQRESDDCAYPWRELPVCTRSADGFHHCVIQRHHKHPCLCRCGYAPSPRWRHLRARRNRDERFPYDPGAKLDGRETAGYGTPQAESREDT